MNIKIYFSFVLLLISTFISAEITISPNTPYPNQDVIISVVNQYGSEAEITNATITRNGNSFVINQTVDISCFLPSAPILTSTFNVGNLDVGEYQVSAIIQNTSSINGCQVDDAITQNTAFGVVAPVITVPLGGNYWMLLLIGLLTLIALFHIKHQRLITTPGLE